MILVLYGENTLASRNALNLAIDRFKRENQGGEIVRLNGEKLAETDLIEALEAASLFSVPRLVVIEGLLTRRLSREKNKLIDYLATVLNQESPVRARTGDSWPMVIIWESKTVAAGILVKFAKLPNSRVQEFKLSPLVFKLLDGLRPGNGNYASRLFSETIKIDPIEKVVMMLGRRIAQLLVAKSEIEGKFTGLKDFQVRQLTTQTTRWTEKQLTDFHRNLVEIDEAVKTGSSPASLSTHLDILLLSL